MCVLFDMVQVHFWMLFLNVIKCYLTIPRTTSIQTPIPTLWKQSYDFLKIFKNSTLINEDQSLAMCLLVFWKLS